MDRLSATKLMVRMAGMFSVICTIRSALGQRIWRDLLDFTAEDFSSILPALIERPFQVMRVLGVIPATGLMFALGAYLLLKPDRVAGWLVTERNDFETPAAFPATIGIQGMGFYFALSAMNDFLGRGSLRYYGYGLSKIITCAVMIAVGAVMVFGTHRIAVYICKDEPVGEGGRTDPADHGPSSELSVRLLLGCTGLFLLVEGFLSCALGSVLFYDVFQGLYMGGVREGISLCAGGVVMVVLGLVLLFRSRVLIGLARRRNGPGPDRVTEADGSL